MLKIIFLTVAAIVTAEALAMLFLESLGAGLSLPLRIFLDTAFLTVCVVPTLYFLVFKELNEQIRLRSRVEREQQDSNQGLELLAEERTSQLLKANEELLVEVQERAKAEMAQRLALNEARAGREQLRDIIHAVRDALVVVDRQGKVQVINQAGEEMFGVSSYDLQGQSLNDFLLPWSRGTEDLEQFLSRDNDDKSIFLMQPASPGDGKHPIQMRFGATLKWEGEPATVMMFYYRDDMIIQEQQVVQNPAGQDGHV